MYFERLVNAVNKLGRLPKTSERKEYNLNFKKSRWPTLDSFILEAIKKGVIEDIDGRYERINTAKDTIKVTEFTSSIQNYKSNIKIPSIPEQTKRKNGRELISLVFLMHRKMSRVLSLFFVYFVTIKSCLLY